MISQIPMDGKVNVFKIPTDKLGKLIAVLYLVEVAYPTLALVIDAIVPAVCDTDKGATRVKLLIEAFEAENFAKEAVIMQALTNDTFVADTFTIDAVVMQALTNDTF